MTVKTLRQGPDGVYGYFDVEEEPKKVEEILKEEPKKDHKPMTIASLKKAKK